MFYKSVEVNISFRGLFYINNWRENSGKTDVNINPYTEYVHINTYKNSRQNDNNRG